MRAAAKNMKVNKYDPAKYGKLLAIVRPRKIESDIEYKTIYRQIGDLMDAGVRRTGEETVLLKLLITLVEEYEQSLRSEKNATPLEVLQYLMEEHGHTAKDLWIVVGDKSLVSRILSGERSISKKAATRLAEFYHVSPALFIF